MKEPTNSPEIEPADYVRAAWGMVKTGPLTVVLRLVSDFATNVVVWAVMIALIGAVFMMFAGADTARITIGIAGMLATALGAFLALDAVVMSVVWTHATRTAGDESQAASATETLKLGLNHFGDALLLRGLNFTARLAIAALFLSWSIPLVVLLARHGSIGGSELWLPAAIFGVAGTFFSLAAGATYLTIELTAPAYFIGKKPLGAAILEAAQLVLERPLYVYRVFVTALSILLPPLCLAWAASIAYALTFEQPGLAAFTGVIRTATNLLLFASLGLFVVMVQFSFFAYYAHRHGIRTKFPAKFLDGEVQEERPIQLEELIPEAPVHRLRVSVMLDETRSSDRSASPSDEEE